MATQRSRNSNQTPAAEEAVSYFVTVRTFGCKSIFHDTAKAETLVDVIDAHRRAIGMKKYAYVVLPDHYHALLGGGPKSESVADLILAINRAVEHFLEVPADSEPLWDAEAEVIVLYTPAARMEKLNYIHHKPVLCGLVEKPQDYAHSSAAYYFRKYGKVEF
jgi:REP element-mobilizing transposase RayT